MLEFNTHSGFEYADDEINARGMAGVVGGWAIVSVYAGGRSGFVSERDD
jgi:hypothetical protein